jgi:hypothetical protein
MLFEEIKYIRMNFSRLKILTRILQIKIQSQIYFFNKNII